MHELRGRLAGVLLEQVDRRLGAGQRLAFDRRRQKDVVAPDDRRRVAEPGNGGLPRDVGRRAPGRRQRRLVRDALAVRAAELRPVSGLKRWRRGRAWSTKRRRRVVVDSWDDLGYRPKASHLIRQPSMRIPVLRTSVTFRQPLAVAGAAAALILAVLTATPSADNWPEWRGGPKRDGRSAETGLPVKWAPPSAKLAGGRRPGLADPDRQPLDAGRVRQPHLSLRPGRRRRAPAGAPGRARRGHRQDGVGEAVPGLPDATFPRTASPGPRPRSIPRPATSSPSAATPTCAASRRTASSSGSGRWPRNTAPSRRTAAAPCRRSIDGDNVIVSTLISAWGTLGRGGNRYFAFDKKTGQTVWISSPQARHYDTNYSTPIVATVDGVRAGIVGGTDGVFHALKAETGEPVWGSTSASAPSTTRADGRRRRRSPRTARRTSTPTRWA